MGMIVSGSSDFWPSIYLAKEGKKKGHDAKCIQNLQGFDLFYYIYGEKCLINREFQLSHFVAF